MLIQTNKIYLISEQIKPEIIFWGPIFLIPKLLVRYYREEKK